MEDAQFMQWTDQHQKADEAQFILLIDQHQQTIGKICRLFRESNEDGENLFKEIVSQLWKSFTNCSDKLKPSTWMYQIALSTSITSNILNTFRPYNTPGTQQGNIEHKEQLIIALKALTEDDKAIFILYLEEMPYAEIAEITGIAETVVGVKLNRIKKRVQQLIDTPKEQYPLKSIWRNIDTPQKSEAELRPLITESTTPTFSILNTILPHSLPPNLTKGGDIKKSLEDQLSKIRSFALLSVISRVIAVGCLLLIVNLIIDNNTARLWTLAAAILIFAGHIAFLTTSWMKRIKQMKFTFNHLRMQREYGRKGGDL